MNYQAFAKMVEEAGLFPRCCSAYHWQINGGEYRVNFYPSKEKVYINGMAVGYHSDAKRAIEIAKRGPDNIGRHAERGQPRRYKAERRRMLKVDPHCHWCRKPLSERTATIDHRIPLGVGGSDLTDNLVLACEPCNKARGHSLGPPR